MNRLLAVVSAAAAISILASAPASADTRHRADPRGDSATGRAYDFVDFAVRNGERRLTTTFTMASLAPSRTKVTAQVDMRFGARTDPTIFSVATTRTHDGAITAYLKHSASTSEAPVRVPCSVSATWGAADSDRVRIVVPQSCLPDASRASFLPSVSPVFGSQDPADFLDDGDGHPLILRVQRG